MNLKSLKHYDEFFICAYCAYCVDYNAACPTFLSIRHEIVTGRGKLITARNLAQAKLKEDEGLNALTKGLFECTFCAACEDVCLVDIPLTEVYTELKSLVQDRLPENTKLVFSNLENNYNIYGLDQEDRNFWSEDVDEIYEEWVGSKNEIGYFVGCVGSYYSNAIEGAVALIKLVKKANETISIFSPTEFCCGNPFLLGGNLEKAKFHAKHNVDEIEKLGIKTLIVSCAGCYRVINNEYPKLLNTQLSFKVKTHMEFMLELIKKGKLRILEKNEVIVSFKDPCELGRHCGIYDVARDLITSLPNVKHKELSNNRENALCCGAGGLLKVNNPNLASDIAHRLINQMNEVGTEICLNACPSCLINISQQLKKENSSIKSLDIAQLVLERTNEE